MKSFYREVYSKSKNNTIRYNQNDRWFTFYVDGLAVTRKVYKNKEHVYYLYYNKEKYSINTWIFNEKLSIARNPTIEF